MDTTQLTLILATAVELLLLFCVVVFYLRLKRSEKLLSQLSANQEALLAKLRVNTELEAELVASFQDRQDELQRLNREMEEQTAELKSLISRAKEVTRSPGLKRQIVVKGHRAGKSVATLARETGMSSDEVELILMESRG